jgi:hypothetical protein
MFCHDVACWTLYGHGGLMVDLRATANASAGGRQRRPALPREGTGLATLRGPRGRGYATEAARALRDWAAATLGLTRLVSYVDRTTPDPPPSPSPRRGADPDAPRQDPGDLVFGIASGG